MEVAQEDIIDTTVEAAVDVNITIIPIVEVAIVINKTRLVAVSDISVVVGEVVANN